MTPDEQFFISMMKTAPNPDNDIIQVYQLTPNAYVILERLLNTLSTPNPQAHMIEKPGVEGGVCRR